MNLHRRTALATQLLDKPAVGEQVTQLFYSHHPEWERRFGEVGRRRCEEDTQLHLSYLAGAVQAGEPSVFVDYARWCAAMLNARGMETGHLLEHLEILQEQLSFNKEECSFIGRFFSATQSALLQPPTSTGEESQQQPTPVQLAYLAAILAGDRRRAWDVVTDAIDDGLTVADAYRDILIWAQKRLGTLWMKAEITVASEHMASAVTQSVIARLYPMITGGRGRGTVLLGGLEGEMHVLPAHFVADLLELQGWDVIFLGTHVPAKDFLATIETERPDVVALSVTIPAYLPRTVRLIEEIRKRHPGLPIVLGGRGAQGAESLSSELDIAVDPAGTLDLFTQFSQEAY